MVMLFRLKAHLGHHGEHFGTQVLAGIDRRDREIAAFGFRAVPEIAAFVVRTRVVRAFNGVDREAGGVLIDVPLHVIEHEEFGFRTEIGNVADAG